MAKRFNILALSGGGFLGLYSAAILSELERTFGQPISKHFDLIAGTSVGGIIALGLASDIAASDIADSFAKGGTAIFSDRPAPSGDWQTLRDLLRFARTPKYQSDGLRRTIEGVIGKETRIGDLKRRIVVPAVNLTKGETQVFKTPHHPDFSRDLHRKLVDVALATSAAPFYFPVAEHDDCLFADGGLFANAPDMVAVHEAEHFLGVALADIHVLSIGTTTSRFSFAHASGRQLGAIGWVRGQRIFNAILATQQQQTTYMLGHRLGDRYLRLDAEKSPEQSNYLALDVATADAQKTLRGLATTTVQANINNPSLKGFFTHNAGAPTFFHSLPLVK